MTYKERIEAKLAEQTALRKSLNAVIGELDDKVKLEPEGSPEANRLYIQKMATRMGLMDCNTCILLLEELLNINNP